jgi:branched-chain amino acid transport system substrate-binding protein
MKNTYIAGAAAVLVLAVAIGVGTSNTKGTVAGESTGPIKIGAVMILSGEGAAWGDASRNGMQLAIDDINAAGGINGRQLEGIYEDDGSDPKKSVSAFNKLVDTDKVSFIIGPNWSNTGLAVAPLAAEKRVVTVSPSLGMKEFNESSDYIFNTWQHDYIIARNLAEYVYASGHRRVAVFGANDVWVKDQTSNFVTRFTELGGTVAFAYEPVPSTTDVRAQVAKVTTDKSIDAIVMTTDGLGLTVVAAKQLRELGVTLPFYNITTDAKIVSECAAACEGMIFPTSLTPTTDFSNRYEKVYGQSIDIGSDSAYDAVMMLAEAMKETNSTDPEKVKVYLANIKTYKGVSGLLTSDGKRAFTKPYLLKVVHNGVAVDLTK